MSNLRKHAEREFKILGWPGECEMQQLICNHVLELLDAFNGHGHSGSSAPYAISLFAKLAAFEPISPLTGADDEWNEVGEGVFQNNRDSEVFKENGEAYWIFGKIFKDKNGCTYTSKDSNVPVVFPWKRPEPEVIDDI